MRKIEISYSICNRDYLYDGYVYDDKQEYFQDLMKMCYRDEGHLITFQGKPYQEVEKLDVIKQRLFRSVKTKNFILNNCQPDEYLICINKKI